MKFGEIYSYRNAKEAKKYIGKKGMFSDSLRDILDLPEACDVLVLMEIKEGVTYPFAGEHKDVFQFFRPILEEYEPLMTNRQLAEWLAKGNGEMTLENNDSYIYTEKVHFKEDEDKPVRDDILIRRWKDTEWMKPTKDIYEEDCKC